MQSASLKGRSILVVEDEPLIALDITLAFVPTGASVTTTNTLAHALILAEHDGLSGAILDHSLPDGDCCKLCARLKERDLPFFIYSGLAPAKGPYADVLHISKPVMLIFGLRWPRR